MCFFVITRPSHVSAESGCAWAHEGPRAWKGLAPVGIGTVFVSGCFHPEEFQGARGTSRDSGRAFAAAAAAGGKPRPCACAWPLVEACTGGAADVCLLRRTSPKGQARTETAGAAGTVCAATAPLTGTSEGLFLTKAVHRQVPRRAQLALEPHQGE